MDLKKSISDLICNEPEPEDIKKFISFRKLNVLEDRNANPRDKNISFKAEGHVYSIKGWDASGFLSVTGWCGSHFPEVEIQEMAAKKLDSLAKQLSVQLMIQNEGREKIESIVAEEIQKSGKIAREKGTELHSMIECILNDPLLPNDYCNGDVYLSFLHTLLSDDNNYGDLAIRNSELHYFCKFLRKFHYLIPYRTEWRLYHEDYKITGTLDAIFKDENGKFFLFDWKRAKEFVSAKTFGNSLNEPELHDYFRNNTYSKYTMQLNVYRIMLKDKYEIDVEGMYILRFGPGERNYELVPIPFIETPIRNVLERRMIR